MIKLTKYEQQMLDGEMGEFKQIAMKNIVKYAEVVGAEELFMGSISLPLNQVTFS